VGHAQQYARRIIFLKGSPEAKAAKAAQRAQVLEDMFRADLDDEEQAIRFYTEAARMAADAGDIGGKLIFEEIVLDEEGHKAWLELQLDLMKRISEQAYTARHMTIDSEAT
jgi:bacterioferritin